MTAIVIRSANLDDIAQLALLFNDYRKFYEQPDNIDLAESFIKARLFNHDSTILVAVDAYKNLIGFCQLYPSFCSVIVAPIYVLYDLFVNASARKVGAGKLLMLAAHEHAKTNHFLRLDLTTAKTNLPAQSLYESLGWVRDEIFYTYSRAV
jgi:ribosomal protein S18 acetylase RimI-like enzyme